MDRLIHVLRVWLALRFGIVQLLPAMSGGAADAELIFRDGASEGALVGDETTAAIDCGPTPLNGMTVRVHIPVDGGAGDKLDIRFITSDTVGGTYLEEDRISWENLSQADGTKTLAGVYHQRVTFRRQFLKVNFDTTDGGGGIPFGAVDCRADSAGEYDNAPRDL